MKRGSFLAMCELLLINIPDHEWCADVRFCTISRPALCDSRRMLFELI